MAKPSKKDVAEIDRLLRLVDDAQVSIGAPVLSVVAVMDGTRRPGQAFWDAVKKYDLRQPNETDKDMVRRLQERAFDYYKKAGVAELDMAAIVAKAAGRVN